MKAVTKPPFFLTYWNPFSKKDPGVVDGFLHYIKDISLADYTANTIGKYLEKTSQSQITAINDIGNKIYGIQSKSYDQLVQLNQSLFNISEDLQDIGYTLSSLDQRMSILLDQVRTTNILNSNIAELLRIPDSQKERQHNLELGIKFFHNASKDKDLYINSLKYLLLAEEKMPEDYFVLHRIGMIYLFIPELLNLEKAAEYFLRAAKYSLTESYTDSISSKNILSLKIGIPFNKQNEKDKNDIKQLCVECFINASTALYALCDFEGASNTIAKALDIDKKNSMVILLNAKYQLRAGNEIKATELIRQIIESEPITINYIYTDLDLISSLKIISVIDKYAENISKKISDIKDKINNSEIISLSDKEEYINKINTLSIDTHLSEKQEEITEFEMNFINYEKKIFLKPELIKYSHILKLVNSEILFNFIQNILQNYDKTSLEDINFELKKTNIAYSIKPTAKYFSEVLTENCFAFVKNHRYLLIWIQKLRCIDLLTGKSIVLFDRIDRTKDLNIGITMDMSNACNCYPKYMGKKIIFFNVSEFYENIYCFQVKKKFISNKTWFRSLLKMRYGKDIYTFLKEHLNNYLFSMIVLSIAHFKKNKSKKISTKENIVFKDFYLSIENILIKKVFKSALDYSLDVDDIMNLITEGLKIFSEYHPELINEFKKNLFQMAVNIEIEDCGCLEFSNRLLKNEHKNLDELSTILNMKIGNESIIHSFFKDDFTNDLFIIIILQIANYKVSNQNKISTKKIQVLKEFHLSIENKIIKTFFKSAFDNINDKLNYNNSEKVISEGLKVFSEQHPELINDFQQNLFKLAVEIEITECGFINFGNKLLKNEHKNLNELSTILNIKIGSGNSIYSYLKEDIINYIFSLIVLKVVNINEIKFKNLSIKERQVFKDFHLSIENKLIKKIFEYVPNNSLDNNNSSTLIADGLKLFSEFQPELINEFKINLYNLAVEIAKADSNFFDFGKKISKNEQKNLEELKRVLELV